MMAGLLHGYLQGAAAGASVGVSPPAAPRMTLDAPQANHVSLSVAAVQQQVLAQAGAMAGTTSFT